VKVSRGPGAAGLRAGRAVGPRPLRRGLDGPGRGGALPGARMKNRQGVWESRSPWVFVARRARADCAFHGPARSRAEGLWVGERGVEAGGQGGRGREDGDSPCIDASALTARPKATRLLEGGADPNQPSLDGDTPLHAAAANGHGATVAVLLQAGADTEHRAPRAPDARRGRLPGMITADGLRWVGCVGCLGSLLWELTGDLVSVSVSVNHLVSGDLVSGAASHDINHDQL
jgi:hypothetical protein